jgi:drug/metabolite transporter (DMT)-like permease
MLLLLFVNSLFSLTYIIIETTLKFTTPLILLTYRMLFAGIAMTLFQFIYNKKLLYIKKEDRMYIFITCLLHMSINFLSETYALQKISSILVSIFYLMSPIFSAIIDYILTKNTLKKEQIITIIIGSILSIIMVILNTNQSDSIDKVILPYILLLISIITSTLAWYRVNIMIKKGYSLVTINGYASLLAGILFLSMTQYTHDTLSLANLNNFTYIIFPAIAVAIIGNIIGYNIYSKLLVRYSITTILFSELLAPCFTAYYQWFFFNITPKINHFIFFILFMICIIIFNYYEHEKKPHI